MSTQTDEVTAEPFDPFFSKLLENIHTGKCIRSYSHGETVFSQGALSEAVWFVESGKIKVSVISPHGKEAVLAILGPRRFFGEDALVNDAVRLNTATALAATTLFRVTKDSLLRALQSQPCLAESFMAGLLSRNMEFEEDLCSQLLDHSEKRLARVLLKLARSHETDIFPKRNVPLVSHEFLAKMVGTTRSRITHFLNEFRKQGLIQYDHTGFLVRPELLSHIVNE